MTWKSAKSPPAKTKRRQTHSEPMIVRCVFSESEFPDDKIGSLAWYAVSEYSFRDKEWQEEYDLSHITVTHWKPFAQIKGDK